METQQLQMLEQLTEIGMAIDGLKANIQRVARQDQGMGDKLTRLWCITQALQRHLACPEVVQGYRDDAVAQVQRIVDLFNECGGCPDSRQLVSIGYACELGRDKISTYVNLDRMTIRKDMCANVEEA